MNRLLTQPTQPLTTAALASIVAQASYLWERLDAERFAPGTDETDEAAVQERCDRWCQVVAKGNEDMLEKRLQWEGLDLATLRSHMGTVELRSDCPFPDWADTLQQIMQAATQLMPTAVNLPLDPEQPVPFEDLLWPALQVARQQLLAKLGPDASALSLLSNGAYRDLERSLLKRLAGLCSKTLDFEFSHSRPFGQNLLNLLGLDAEEGISKKHYIQFVNQLLEDGLLSFFQKYSVLGRLVGTTVNFWVEATADFLENLTADYSEIQQKFGKSQVALPGQVIEIQTSLSDPHKRGRTVILLTFESGLKLVYKPKDLGLEATFNDFLHWCNQHSQLLDLKVTQVLSRNGYGWVEYIEHLPVPDIAAAARFYQRAGMLLCVLYALRGTDCHYENLIASGEHLVLIDTETLLHHEPVLIEDSPLAQEYEATATQQLWDSVLRTGLLPRWDFSADRQVAYDISGLGSTDSQQAPRKGPRWQHINTDQMHLRYEATTLAIAKNVPYLDGVALSPNDYQAQIAAGFEQMYRFLMDRRAELLSPESPLAAMGHQSVRFIFRATRTYALILQKSLAPDCLKQGVDYSIQLDYLSCAFLVAQERPTAWPILNAELRAMEQLDIPFFTASAVIDELPVADQLAIAGYFKQPSYQDVLNQLQTLDETDLARQRAIIQGAFDAKVAQTATQAGEQWDLESLPPLSPTELLAEATAIARELEARAIVDPDGSANWIGLAYVPRAERYQLHVLNHCLSDGRGGIALFLAALSQVTGDPQARSLALQALQPLRRQIHTLDLESRQRLARFNGMGGATGLGSIIYSLVKISQFLGDVTLLQDALVLADWITPDLITADEHLDVMSGAAGGILGLLSLYEATQDRTVLDRAIAAGQHLLVHQPHRDRPCAWQTFWEKPLTGFSHGAAGIAYALLRLYAVTQAPCYMEAAQAGMDYERSVFSATDGNWPDFRRMGPSGQPGFATKWCHGAAGIGLGRLGSYRICPTAEIRQEIEVALQTTQNFGLQAVDHLCCGNLGRAEVLLVGATLCDRPDWQQFALQSATNVVARARRTGAYQLFPNLPTSVFNPGFLPGTAGIGYGLLRLANPALPSILLWE